MTPDPHAFVPRGPLCIFFVLLRARKSPEVASFDQGPFGWRGFTLSFIQSININFNDALLRSYEDSCNASRVSTNLYLYHYVPLMSDEYYIIICVIPIFSPPSFIYNGNRVAFAVVTCENVQCDLALRQNRNYSDSRA